MSADDAIRLGIEVARVAARGDPHEELLVEGVRRLLSADGGVGVARWDFASSEVGRIRMGAVTVRQITAEQEAAALRLVNAHPSFACMLREPTLAHRTSDVVRLPGFWRTEAYEAMHGYFGGRYPAGVPLLRTESGLMFLGVHRQAGDFTDRDMELLSAVGEPVRAAIRFRAALDRAAAKLPFSAALGEETFTAKEVDVLVLVAAGWTDGHVARRLGISEATVRHRLTTARDRVGAVNRTHLVVRWLEMTGQATNGHAARAWAADEG